MKGTEKQVAWAEKIKKVYEEAFTRLVNSDYENTDPRYFDDIWAEVTTSFLIGGEDELPNAKYHAWRQSAEYANYKSRKATMTKDERNAFLRSKKKEFRKAFMDKAAEALKNDDARFWIDHRLK